MRRAVIIDLDGTLCDVRHRTHLVRQSPPDWGAFFAACVDDTPNHAVLSLLHMAADAGYAVLLVSGRPEESRGLTEQWLARFGLARHAALLMRPDGDFRPDAVVKREIYETTIAGHYDVVFAVDDRAVVVQMWRDLGLTCLQVAEGDF